MDREENQKPARAAKPEQNSGEGHRERLRERFLTGGLDGFLDYEVVELLLTLGTPRRDCKQTAKEAVRRFRSLEGVLAASRAELCQVPGIGPRNAFGILLCQAVARRYLKEKARGKDAVNSPRELMDFLQHALRDKKTESFLVIFLDNQNQVLDLATLSEGTVNESAVYPREIARAALERHAAAVILAHNHPSGKAGPSDADIAVTLETMRALHPLGIRVHEHLIIGENSFFSFTQNKLMVQLRKQCGIAP
ncbi:MAG: DNA repair protein RadC [Thermodesulfobacteriota bacterium]